MTVQGFCLKQCQHVNSNVTFLSTPSSPQPDRRVGAQLFRSTPEVQASWNRFPWQTLEKAFFFYPHPLPPVSDAYGTMQDWQCLFTWPRKSFWYNCAHILNSQVCVAAWSTVLAIYCLTYHCWKYFLWGWWRWRWGVVGFLHWVF